MAVFHVAPAMQHPKECCQYTTSVDINNTHYKKFQALIQNHMSMCAVSLLESREQCYIKAMNNNNNNEVFLFFKIHAPSSSLGEYVFLFLYHLVTFTVPNQRPRSHTHTRTYTHTHTHLSLYMDHSPPILLCTLWHWGFDQNCLRQGWGGRNTQTEDTTRAWHKELQKLRRFYIFYLCSDQWGWGW